MYNIYIYIYIHMLRSNREGQAEGVHLDSGLGKVRFLFSSAFLTKGLERTAVKVLHSNISFSLVWVFPLATSLGNEETLAEQQQQKKNILNLRSYFYFSR